MPDRFLPQGALEPPIKVRVADENGLKDLGEYEKIELEALSDDWEISGEMSVISPPETVRINNQLVEVNAQYVLQPGDSDKPGTYLLRVKATRPAGSGSGSGDGERVEFFPNELSRRERLIIEAAPTGGGS